MCISFYGFLYILEMVFISNGLDLSSILFLKVGDVKDRGDMKILE